MSAADAPGLYDRLVHGAGLPFLVTSAVAGLVSLGLLLARRYLAVRLTAAAAVAAVIWGWAAAQYPELLPGLSVEAAAADETVLVATLAALGVGAAFLLPSLWWLYATFQRDREHPSQAPGEGGR